MLHEIRYVKQDRPGVTRRWFMDDEWDLYVWIREDGAFSGFQLCYDKSGHQRALTWMENSRPVHTAVEETGMPTNMEAPILVADGTLDARSVARRFWTASKELDPQIRIYVIRKLKELM